MCRDIHADVQEVTLMEDLERYRTRACALGAADAVVIAASQIVVDERVQGKCLIPRCENYGHSAHCPPTLPPLDEVRRIIARYHWGVLLKIEVPTDVSVKKDIIWRTQELDIVCNLESEAYYDGYYLAMGISALPCKSTLCPTVACAALTPGGHCPYPFRARPSLQGLGIDVIRLVNGVGWTLYPVGTKTTADTHPISLIGLVLIH